MRKTSAVKRALVVVLASCGVYAGGQGAEIVQADPPAPVTPTPEPPLADPPRAVIEPLSGEARALLDRVREDSPAVVLGGVTEASSGRHYVTSNEHALHAFRDAIADLGGAYVGVGSDQAYLLIGWARPEIAWLVDYDEVVVDLHRVHIAVVRAAPTPADYLAAWTKAGREAAYDAIDEHCAAAERARLRGLYRRNRAAIERRLAQTATSMAAAEVPSWLDDDASYTHVRQLALHDRLRPLVVDLAGARGLRSIARAARALDVPIRVLYLSNAEEYWRLYPDAFRDNVAALPFDDRSLVLRTLLIWHVNEDYRYNLQPARTFTRWLDEDWVGNVYHVTWDRPEIDATGINAFWSTALPQDAPKALRAAARRKIREILAQEAAAQADAQADAQK